MTDPIPPGKPTAPADGRDVVVRMSGIEKSFGSVLANRGAELEVRAGEVHALVGENGAGKSTLMRILAGMFAPDAGRVEVFGRDATGWTTAEAIAAGVGMVHQHFMLVPTLTVAENLVLGTEPTRGMQLDLARARRDVEELSRRTGLPVRADVPVSRLSVGEAQRVEILKALFRGARVLILDEPTAVLSPPEVAELWKVLRRLRDEEGATVVLITHRLDEVMEVSDTITVMRHGATVTRIRTAETSPGEIARAMVGRDVALAMEADLAPPPHAPPPAGAAPALEVRDLVVGAPGLPRAVDGVSFAVAPGEILGIAGVEGNGQTELIEAIAGLTPVASGTVLLGGREVTALGVRERGEAGLSHVPEDRHRRGLVLDYTVAENLVLGQQRRFQKGWALDRGRLADNAREQTRAFDIRPPDPSLPARALSGGNQQKVVIAREMGRDFSVLLASQPTRGVDVGAVEQIHAEIRRARDAGKAVLLVSAELNEVLALSDRVAVMYGGRFAAVLPRAEASAETLGPYMTGARREEAA
jgi:simple sugar transport system ATP-binding protein